MTEQSGAARYPAVVALLRRERDKAGREAAYYEMKARDASEMAEHIRARLVPRADDGGNVAWWENNAGLHRELGDQRRELVRQIDAALATLAEDRWDPIEENMTLIGAIEKAVRLLDCGRPETARKYLVGALPAGVRDALGFAGGDDAALAVLGGTADGE